MRKLLATTALAGLVLFNIAAHSQDASTDNTDNIPRISEKGNQLSGWGIEDAAFPINGDPENLENFTARLDNLTAKPSNEDLTNPSEAIRSLSTIGSTTANDLYAHFDTLISDNTAFFTEQDKEKLKAINTQNRDAILEHTAALNEVAIEIETQINNSITNIENSAANTKAFQAEIDNAYATLGKAIKTKADVLLTNLQAKLEASNLTDTRKRAQKAKIEALMNLKIEEVNEYKAYETDKPYTAKLKEFGEAATRAVKNNVSDKGTK